MVDDHEVLREPLAFMFDREPDFEVVAQAGTLAEARDKLEDVDVAVIDLDLPDGNGRDLLGDLRSASPRSLALILTSSSYRAEYARAVEAGASGVLHKSTRIGEVIGAVRKLLSGETLLSPNETGELVLLAQKQRLHAVQAQEAAERLTSREREILQCLAQGHSDKDIADRLYVSSGTVRNHVVNVLGKLGVHSRLQALVFAIRHGLVELD